jgi:hypothetical protein
MVRYKVTKDESGWNILDTEVNIEIACYSDKSTAEWDCRALNMPVNRGRTDFFAGPGGRGR